MTSFNLHSAELEEDEDESPEDFAARGADIGPAIGGEHLAGTLLAFMVVAVLAGLAAAILPARRASRLNVLGALHYE